MNIKLQRKIDRIVGTFMCRIFSLFPKKRGKVSIYEKPSRILVILLSEMGSLVLARPMFDYIKERYPRASIYVLLFDRNKACLEILDILPSENIISISGESLSGLLKDSVRALMEIRRNRIDTVLDCELFSRISSIFSFLSGANIRVGFHPYNQEGLFRGNFINRPLLYNPYRHISQQFLALARAIESEEIPKIKYLFSNENVKMPHLRINREEMNGVWKRLMRDFPQILGKNLIFIYPSGGLLPIRAWPLQYFCTVAADLIRNGYAVGITGMESDRGFAREIADFCESENCLDLTGYTKTVRELMILFHFGSLLITNDGGPGHFASMTPIPAIILYGPETPTLYGSLDEKAVNLHVPLSCSPCLTAYNHRNSPCDGDNVCLKSIAPKVVLEKAYGILKDETHDALREKMDNF